MAAPTSSNATSLGDNKVSATQTSPIVNTSAVRMTTDAAAQVFNTPELLELILSKLEVRDILLGASLTCRAFRTSIDSSPTINARLGSYVIDAMPEIIDARWGQHYCCRSLRLAFYPVTAYFHIVLDFSAVSIEQYISSPSFRKLRMPKIYIGRDSRGEEPMVYYLGFKPVPVSRYTPVDTIAGLLKLMLSQDLPENTVNQVIVRGRTIIE